MLLFLGIVAYTASRRWSQTRTRRDLFRRLSSSAPLRSNKEGRGRGRR